MVAKWNASFYSVIEKKNKGEKREREETLMNITAAIYDRVHHTLASFYSSSFIKT